jgi:hypothetical protein
MRDISVRPKARPPRENATQKVVYALYPACIFIQHHHFLWIRPMVIVPARNERIGIAPVLTYKDATGWIRVSEKATSRQFVNRGEPSAGTKR